MKPLHLPPGSIRAIITLLVILTLCGVAAYRGSVPSDLAAIAVLIVKHYFDAREKEAKSEQRPACAPLLVE